MENSNVWYVTEQLVRSLGIREKYKGYFYLISAVVISVETGMRKADLYKEVYEKVASLNDVSAESVEKCIRTCIKRVWKLDPYVFSELAGREVEKPTNEEVIAIISSRIRLERQA